MKRSQLFLILLILVLGLFFRAYKIVERMDFGHDADLYSWIAKDIVSGHFRLIGQLTSAPGIYIGPLFYYFLVPFFALTGMDPVGANLFAILLGIATILSYYFCLSKIFNEKVGLIGAFLYAVLPVTFSLDRWIVPTMTTSLWSIWYFYALVNISRGKSSNLWLMGILIGLIWHVHIALIPVLITLPIAIILAKKMPSFKRLAVFVIFLLGTCAPLIIFELKHNFSQTFSLISNFGLGQEGGPTGVYKFQLILEMLPFPPLVTTGILISVIFLIKKKLIALKEALLIFAWIAGPILFFSLSSSPISEYYFANTNVVFLVIFSLVIFVVHKKSLFLSLILLGFIFLRSLFLLLDQDHYAKGYLEKKAVVDYIVADAKIKNFLCFSLNYITSPGENVGFRYFFFLKNAHIAVPGRGSPVYNIVIPDEYALNEVKVKFGHIGIIPPTQVPSKDLMTDACSGQNTNLTDPMLGYAE